MVDLQGVWSMAMFDFVDGIVIYVDKIVIHVDTL